MPVFAAQSRPNWFSREMATRPGGVPLLFHQLDGAVHILFDVGSDLPAVQQARIHQHLAGVVAAEFRNDRRGDLFPLELGDMAVPVETSAKQRPAAPPFRKILAM